MSIFRPYLILGMPAMFRFTLVGSNEKLFVVWDRHRERPYASVRTRLSAARSRNGAMRILVTVTRVTARGDLNFMAVMRAATGLGTALESAPQQWPPGR